MKETKRVLEKRISEQKVVAELWKMLGFWVTGAGHEEMRRLVDTSHNSNLKSTA